MSDAPKEMVVTKIDNGTVLDRIPPGRSLAVLSLLGINENYDHTVAIAIHVPSKKMGSKDIIKIKGKFLTESELNTLGIIIPGATYNIVKDYEVSEKIKLERPSVIHRVLKCNNRNCATNLHEPIETEFRVVQDEPLLLQCKYCERFLTREDILEQLL